MRNSDDQVLDDIDQFYRPRMDDVKGKEAQRKETGLPKKNKQLESPKASGRRRIPKSLRVFQSKTPSPQGETPR